MNNDMLKTYLHIAFRNLRRHRGYAAINIVGLAVGLAACLLILLFIQGELRYDAYHAKADRIVRMTRYANWASGGRAGWALTPLQMAAALKEDYPEVTQVARLSMEPNKLVQAGDNRFFEEKVGFADPELFDLFDLPVIAGEPAVGLREPFTLFISESMSKKYFGDSDPISKELLIDNTYTFVVTGVFVDLPKNTHLGFDFLGSFESLFGMGVERDRWDRRNVSTYALISSSDAVDPLAAKMPAFRERYMPDLDDSNAFVPTPLLDLHLRAPDIRGDVRPKGDIRYVWLFSAIAMLILGIACINYLNLATASASKKAREIAVRKAVGALRHQLIAQFLVESVLLTLMSLVGAWVLASLALPLFNGLMLRDLSLELSRDPEIIGMSLGLALFVGIGAGSYPAFFLASFEPERVLKGNTGQRRSLGVSKGLVVFQFFVSVSLIAATVVIYNQMQLVRNDRPGFADSQILAVSTRGGTAVAAGSLENALDGRYDTFRSELMGISAIEYVASASSLLQEGAISMISPEEVEGGIPDEQTSVVAYGFFVDYDYLETMGLQLVSGRFFGQAFSADAEQSIVVNETMVKTMGWESPVGKWIEVFGTRFNVIGVVKDYHNNSYRDPIHPQYFSVRPGASNFVLAKISGRDLPQTLASIERIWNRMAPAQPFRYSFVDEEFAALYRADIRLGQLLGSFALLAILVACLGLFGLASFTAEQRTKEIGIRKILGAAVSNIVVLLSRDFFWLMLVGFVLACPAVYLGMQRWLDGFVYRIDITWHVFVLAGSIAMLLALGTVGYQALRAALADPVRSLRYE